MKYIKKDETTLTVVKTIEAKTEENNYDLNFLKQQEIAILKQRDDFVEARDKELEEVRNLIKQAKKLGIKEKVEVEAVEELPDPELELLDKELVKAKDDLAELEKESVAMQEKVEANVSDVVSDLEAETKDVEELIN